MRSFTEREKSIRQICLLFFVLIFFASLGFSLSQSEKDTALTLKKTGDQYVEEGDYKKAAEQYLRALRLAREEFSKKERLSMARYMAWGEKHEEAAAELKLILDKDPEDLEARVTYARVLSWAGKYDLALKEAYTVLDINPTHKEALLIVADVLNWSSKRDKAIPIYLMLLEKEENFEARLGLIYCLLATGEKRGAKANREILKPSYPYQEMELEKLDVILNKQDRPQLEAKYSYYDDSVENIVHTYSSKFSFWAGNWEMDLSFKHIDANGNLYDNEAEDLSFSIYSRIKNAFGFGMGIGGTQLGENRSANFLTGHAKMDFNFLAGQIGALASHEVYAYTSLLIENQIRVSTAGIYLTQSLSKRLILQGNYYFRYYSDNNNSNDLTLSGSLVFRVSGPRALFGYSYRMLDFRRQTESGYFDPDDFHAHMIFLTFVQESEKFFLYVYPYFGHQSFHTYGEKVEDYFAGASGTIRFALSRRWWLEFHGEGGNYAAAMAPGWKYFLVSAGLIYRF